MRLLKLARVAAVVAGGYTVIRIAPVVFIIVFFAFAQPSHAGRILGVLLLPLATIAAFARFAYRPRPLLGVAAAVLFVVNHAGGFQQLYGQVYVRPLVRAYVDAASSGEAARFVKPLERVRQSAWSRGELAAALHRELYRVRDNPARIIRRVDLAGTLQESSPQICADLRAIQAMSAGDAAWQVASRRASGALERLPACQKAGPGR